MCKALCSNIKSGIAQHLRRRPHLTLTPSTTRPPPATSNPPARASPGTGRHIDTSPPLMPNGCSTSTRTTEPGTTVTLRVDAAAPGTTAVPPTGSRGGRSLRGPPIPAASRRPRRSRAVSLGRTQSVGLGRLSGPTIPHSPAAARAHRPGARERGSLSPYLPPPPSPLPAPTPTLNWALVLSSVSVGCIPLRLLLAVCLSPLDRYTVGLWFK